MFQGGECNNAWLSLIKALAKNMVAMTPCMHADMRCKNYLGFSREVRPLVWLVLGDRAARVSRFTRDSSGFETELLWPVVQSWISAKPRLKFNLLL